MKKSELKPGTKVIASIEYGEEYSDDEPRVARYFCADENEPLVGVVNSKETARNKVSVFWIEGPHKGQDEEVDVKVLALASDVPALEKEFASAQKQIQKKLKKAGKLVLEANKIAQKVGAPHLERLYYDVKPLVNAMDDSGWRSSSWGC